MLPNDFSTWAKTVESNPIPTIYSIKAIAELFTSRFFPDDPDIALKKENLFKAIEEYSKNPIICPGTNLPDGTQCKGHGKCVDIGYFTLGECQCDGGWEGWDCGVPKTKVNKKELSIAHKLKLIFFFKKKKEVGGKYDC